MTAWVRIHGDATEHYEITATGPSNFDRSETATVKVDLARRPTYCDRGDWLAVIFQNDGLNVDSHDMWPRYYFGPLAIAQDQVERWLRKRGLMPVEQPLSIDEDKLSTAIDLALAMGYPTDPARRKAIEEVVGRPFPRYEGMVAGFACCVCGVAIELGPRLVDVVDRKAARPICVECAALKKSLGTIVGTADMGNVEIDAQ